jgi:uncharacterized protein (DUF2236 family)
VAVLQPLNAARDVGESVTLEAIERLRVELGRQVRHSIGFPEEPLAACEDPELAYFPPDSVTRQIHLDLPAMLVGGLSALLLQMLHPLAMAGVARFSDYKNDPLGRLERTGMFVGATTFGTKVEARAAIDQVQRIHRAVTGTAPDGRPYSATDPDLLRWVHAAEVRSFLAAAVRYGPTPLSPAAQDAYLAEMARVGLDLGAGWVPTNRQELAAYFDSVRPELKLTAEGREARNFVLRGVGRWPHELGTYALLVSAATGLLPTWARRQLRLPAWPDSLAVRPATIAVTSAVRWANRPA